jgi:hypothetical protein
MKTMTRDEVLAEQARADLLESLNTAREAVKGIRRLLPSEAKDVITHIVRLPGPSLFHVVEGRRRVNSVELTRRVMVAMESALEASRVASERPRPHMDKGGWKPIRQPTPGRCSGTRRGSL